MPMRGLCGSHLRAARHRYACRNSWHIRISVRHCACLSAARARSATRQACRLGSHRWTMKRHGHGVQPFMAQPALWSIAACARTTLGPPACARASPWPIRMRSTMRWVAADPRSGSASEGCTIGRIALCARTRDASSHSLQSAPQREIEARVMCRTAIKRRRRVIVPSNGTLPNRGSVPARPHRGSPRRRDRSLPP